MQNWTQTYRKKLINGHYQLVYLLDDKEEITVTAATNDARNVHKLPRGAIASRLREGDRTSDVLWRPRGADKVRQ
jgi:hypothetical protein